MMGITYAKLYETTKDECYQEAATKLAQKFVYYHLYAFRWLLVTLLFATHYFAIMKPLQTEL